MAKRGGYIKLFRSITADPLWTKEAFTRGQAWVDLLLLANYKPGHIRVRGNRIAVGRGQVGWSVERLAERWHWSRGKVTRFLNELEDEHQIGQQKSAVSSVVTITNYEHYQRRGHQNGQQTDTKTNVEKSVLEISIHENEHQNGQQNLNASGRGAKTNERASEKTDTKTGDRRTADDTADGHQNGALKKKCKKEKKVRGARTKFVKPAIEEVAAYCRERGNGVDPQRWFDHYESNGWKVGRNAMKDWKAAVRKWENSDYANNSERAPKKSEYRTVEPHVFKAHMDADDFKIRPYKDEITGRWYGELRNGRKIDTYPTA